MPLLTHHYMFKLLPHLSGLTICKPNLQSMCTRTHSLLLTYFVYFVEFCPLRAQLRWASTVSRQPCFLVVLLIH